MVDIIEVGNLTGISSFDEYIFHLRCYKNLVKGLCFLTIQLIRQQRLHGI